MDDYIKHATHTMLHGHAVKTGSYRVERHLVGGTRLAPGCWVTGKTVSGKIQIGSKHWPAFTRPVFAYLAPIDTLRLSGRSNQRHDVTFNKGHSKQFMREVDATYSLSSAIERVNILSSLHTGFSDDDAWGAPGDQRVSLLLPGSGVFALYQMNLVYAHCVPGAGAETGKVFRTRTLQARGSPAKPDLYYLSSICTTVYAAVPDAAATPPITWEALQRLVLIDGYDAARNAGAWAFDFSANENIHCKY